MKINALLLSMLALLSNNAFAANDVYGTVSEVITRSGPNGDNALYFRIAPIENNAHFESCIVDGQSMTWHIDLDSAVANFQYQLIMKSYTEQLPVRVIGQDNVCSEGNTSSDSVFELSPWSWPTLSTQK
ncbi:hypothetical protein NI389_08330 [Pseudoalteromonas xiamenensis]|uniref:hypothetical protein n=1 Tax=Pseudoalteromonas xiamenensis TaxID=882626 RepID=UPI0027E3BFA7|nr:hypothetical protein [Pseudoalteromonas xiamenensis]WMN61373.1 hypothetical protein NI389_08330 [Pseudoalteromonas xiamenensis]